MNHGKKTIANTNPEKFDRKLANGFKDGPTTFLMTRKKRNNKKRRANVMIVEYISGPNLGTHSTVSVILKSTEAAGFSTSSALVKLCFSSSGQVKGILIK